MSKQVAANEIYRDEMGKPDNGTSLRQRVIKRIESELGMTSAGASTYCANAKKFIEAGGVKTSKPAKTARAVDDVPSTPRQPLVPRPIPDDHDVLYSAVRVDKDDIALEVSCWRDRECAEKEAENKKWKFVVGTQKAGQKLGVVETGSKPKK